MTPAEQQAYREFRQSEYRAAAPPSDLREAARRVLDLHDKRAFASQGSEDWTQWRDAWAALRDAVARLDGS